MDENGIRVRAIELTLQWGNENSVEFDTMIDLLTFANDIAKFISSGEIPKEEQEDE